MDDQMKCKCGRDMEMDKCSGCQMSSEECQCPKEEGMGEEAGAADTEEDTTEENA